MNIIIPKKKKKRRMGLHRANGVLRLLVILPSYHSCVCGSAHTMRRPLFSSLFLCLQNLLLSQCPHLSYRHQIVQIRTFPSPLPPLFHTLHLHTIHPRLSLKCILTLTTSFFTNILTHHHFLFPHLPPP